MGGGIAVGTAWTGQPQKNPHQSDVGFKKN